MEGLAEPLEEIPHAADPAADPTNEDWLRLHALEFAPHRLHSLLEAYGSNPAAVFRASPSEWKARLPQMSEKRLAKMAAVRNLDFSKTLAAMEKHQTRLVTFRDAVYPANLRPLPDAPPVLFLRGTLIPEDKFSIAIVGSRRATSYGLDIARQFARELAQHGLTIVSGGASGVDTRAHKGALEGGGRTLAYLGSGVDIAYPAANKDLFREIAESGGAVLSEFTMEDRPEPWHFPARNRLISGTSLEVPTVEQKVSSPNTPGR